MNSQHPKAAENPLKLLEEAWSYYSIEAAPKTAGGSAAPASQEYLQAT